jgi:hypothetical protein
MGEWASGRVGETEKRRKGEWGDTAIATKWLNRIAQGFSPGYDRIVDAPCLSAVVSGIWDEGGKGRPNENPSASIAVRN